MKKVCAWCKTDLGEVPSDLHPSDAITHGICRPCATRMLSSLGESMQAFLDRLGIPVVLVDPTAHVLCANTSAQTVLGKNLPAIKDHVIGSVIECIHASKPGGCGKTVHCRSCTIRQAVLQTHATGASQVNVPALQDIVLEGVDTQVRYRISTEKIGDYILLRIDDVQAAPPA